MRGKCSQTCLITSFTPLKNKTEHLLTNKTLPPINS